MTDAGSSGAFRRRLQEVVDAARTCGCGRVAPVFIRLDRPMAYVCVLVYGEDMLFHEYHTILYIWRRFMDKDQVKGRIKEVDGKVEELAGEAVGNRKMAQRGKARKIAGKGRGVVRRSQG